ncbi:MAG: hypothetical protein AAFR71_14070 [Pseudomonadota bacterium]
MLRLINFALIAVVIAMATWTYQVKHQADEKLAEIKKLERQIARERQTIELLQAEWAYLSNPARLQALIETYADELDLSATTTDQLISPSELPDRPAFAPGDAISDIIAGDVDTIVSTGSVSEAE